MGIGFIISVLMLICYIYCFTHIKADDYESACSKLEGYIKRLEDEELFYAIGYEVNSVDKVEEIL